MNSFSVPFSPLGLVRRILGKEVPNPDAAGAEATPIPQPPNASFIEAPSSPSPEGTRGRRRRRRGRRRSSGTTPTPTAAETTEEGSDDILPRIGLFGELQVSGKVDRALRDMGYLEPTPVQQEVIPLMLEGRDVVGQAQTGTGKTAAFGIPLMEGLDPEASVVQAIVLVPTRELALQVSGELRKLAKYSGHRVVTLYGGQPIIKQFPQLDPPPQIVVGTPGRVLDHLGRGTLHLTAVQVAILDEADEMLDIGFAPDMERILRLTPRSRQTSLFSATMPPFILRMIQRYMRDPRWVRINPEAPTVPEIEQIYYEVAQRDKLDALCALLAEWGALPRALVFCRMQVGVDRLTAALQRRGYQVQGIHGGMAQPERTRVMAGFREGSIQALIATNVAARGLDIPDITHVVSYDAPQNVEEYIHRIGRTGRMGRDGTAITFFAEGDFEVLDGVKARMGEALRQERSSIYTRLAV